MIVLYECGILFINYSSQELYKAKMWKNINKDLPFPQFEQNLYSADNSVPQFGQNICIFESFVQTAVRVISSATAWSFNVPDYLFTSAGRFNSAVEISVVQPRSQGLCGETVTKTLVKFVLSFKISGKKLHAQWDTSVFNCIAIRLCRTAHAIFFPKILKR